MHPAYQTYGESHAFNDGMNPTQCKRQPAGMMISTYKVRHIQLSPEGILEKVRSLM
jgi:hypothetical protein